MQNKFEMHAYAPTDRLKPFIKTYFILESQEEVVNRILPGTSLVMAFRYKGQVQEVTGSTFRSLPPFALSGLQKSARLIHYAKNSGNLLVLFKEAGVRAFLNMPLHELFEESVSLRNFISSSSLSILEEQLADASNNQQRVTLVEHFLLSRFQDILPDKLLETATQRIQAAQGFLPIKELAKSLYISQDAFEKRFRKIVGTTPKQYSSVIRLRSVLHQTNSPLKLTQLALESGYFDQPHFTNAFKLFTGQTPTDFFKNPLFW